MILSDRDIREAMIPGERWHHIGLHSHAQVYAKLDPLIIEPMPEDDCFQPASVDLTLGGTEAYTDVYGNDHIKPGEFLLAYTAETVTIPNWLVGQVDGKSTLARQGLAVHVTAGYIDPGFTGQITLELVNHSSSRVYLRQGMKIAQMVLTRLSSPALRPYGHPALKSHYQGQIGLTPARTD